MENKKIKIGVLALQGDFLEHKKYFEKFAEVAEVRNKKELEDVDSLVIPGGESTTIGKLLKSQDLEKALIEKIKKGMPTLGTCAGAIILGKGSEYSLGLIDAEIERNAYGRQTDSFEAKIKVPVFGNEDFSAIFIRAPKFKNLGKKVEILAEYKRFPIFIKSGNVVCTSFHPELSDARFAEWFLELSK